MTAKRISSKKLASALVAVAALFGLALASPTPALAGPVLGVTSRHTPARIPAGGGGQYEIAVSNSGDAATTTAPITVTFSLPADLQVTTAVSARVLNQSAWACTIAPDAQSVSCTGPRVITPRPINPGQEACQSLGATCHIFVNVSVDPGLQPGTVVTPTVEACGGGAAGCANASDPTEIIPYVFDITGFDGNALLQNGDPAAQAGVHPHTASTTFSIVTTITPQGNEIPLDNLKDVIVNLPPGLIGNPQAVASCPMSDLTAGAGPRGCPDDAAIGLITLDQINTPGAATKYQTPIYNMKAPQGTAALLGFNIVTTAITVSAKLRTGGDYGVTTIAANIQETLKVRGARVVVWGVPADSSHDRLRGDCITVGGNGDPSGDSCPSSDAASPRAFFTLPTSCTGQPIETTLDATGWQGSAASASFLSHDNTLPTPNPIPIDGCNALDFSPTLKARPTTNVADSPTGFDVDLHIPQNDDPNGTATAHLRDTIVTLSDGLVINPSGANGLDGCSSGEIGLATAIGAKPIHFTEGPARCPDASKVATVSVETPLLDHPVPGAVYIADPFDNPFDSLLAIYIVVDDKETGIVAKLAGEVSPDPNTGRLTTTFVDNPQVPFEDFHLDFFGGAGASLKTPATCGTYETISSLTPWSFPDSGPPATPSDTWSITQSPGGACANSPGEQPHTPSFDAGAVSPIAGAHSPFVVNLRREDGSQQFSAITVSPPQGLVAKLVGTEICPQSALDAAAAKKGNEERASPSCPAASEVGNVVGAAGAGPAPYYASGKAYIAGPYKGAPLSLATIIPATAGPFDLGTIVTRVAVHVNPKTAEITAVSDPIPSILEGIPLDVRSVHVALDRPNFSLNPTSCDPMAVRGQLTSLLGQVASLESRFQLAECTGLGFKPKMTLNLKGGTKRGKHPALTIALMPRPGDANIASVSVALPRSEFLENAHIRTVCTRPDFAADICPAAAVYGEATVDTPLLDYDLAGHVYLRSSDNLLPDVVPDLRGPVHQPIKLETSGRTDSIRGGIRTTIDFVPDAPFTKAVVALQGGNKGLLVNSRNICERIYRATIRYTAHNGKTYVDHPPLKAKCGRRAKRGKRAKRAGHRR